MMASCSTLIPGYSWPVAICLLQLHLFLLRTLPVYGAHPQILNTSQIFQTSENAFQKITVSDINGDVFVGATNQIWQLDPSLGLIDQQSSLWLSENSDCADGDASCLYPEDMENVNSVLLLDSSKNILISCGRALNGTCLVLNSSRISDVKARVISENNALSSLGLGRSVVSFIGGVPKSEENGYYIGATFDNTATHTGLDQHAVSTKRLIQTNSGGWKFEYGFSNPELSRYTYIDILEGYRTDFRVDYVYGFTSGNYSYFLTVQPERVTSTNYVTRIIRICTQDKSYYSYIEMNLVCRQTTRRSKNYNLLQSAFVGEAGAALADDLGIGPMDEVLYGVFSASEPGSDIPTADSALCVYPLSKITSQIMRGLKRCFESGIGSQGLPFMTRNNQPCSIVTSFSVPDDFCGTGQLHPIEITTYSANSRDFLVGGGAGHQFTSLAVAVDGEDTISIMGTSDGSILKYVVEPLSIEGVQRGYASVPYKHLQLDTPGPVLRDMPFDLAEEHLYVMTANKIYKVEVSTCAHYKGCSVCVSTSDPNICGWCAGSCTTEDECLAGGKDWTRESCSPAIYQVSPTSVPLTGGSYVSVLGDSLGALLGSGTHSVSLAGHPCEIDQTASSHNKIVCAAPTVSSPTEGAVIVQVNVQHVAGFFNVSGIATAPSEYMFSFVEPVIRSFKPPNGPSFGGTEVTILGDHLDAGNTRQISVAGTPCEIREVDRRYLSCMTSFGVADSSGKISVTIDTHTFRSRDSYTFTKNPLISDIKPAASILSGGINVTVDGSSLDLVQSLSMVLNISDVIYKGDCTLTSDMSATCLSPDLTSSGLIFEIDEGLTFDLNFEFNGYMMSPAGTIVIYPDPIVEPFERQVYLSAGETLAVQGLNFKMSEEMPEPVVYVDGSVCEVTYVNNTSIFCSLPALPAQSEGEKGYYTEVQLGNFTGQVGRVFILPRVSNPGLVVLLIVIILTSIVLVLVLLFLIRKRRAKTASFEHQSNGDLPTAESMVVFRNGTGSSDGDATLAPAQPPIPNTYLRQPSQMDSPEMLIGGAAASESSPLLERIPKDIAIQISDVLVQEDNLTLGDVLGRGHFGCVYEGRYFQDGQEMHVAVKSLLRGGTSDISAFLKEGIMMKDFNHRNVLALFGVCITRDNQPLVILPYMANGDLLTYVRNGKNELTMRQLLHFCRQIAEGMSYLSGLKFVHRDLAARNCMLDDTFVAKVADFGLSRDIYERDYYSGKDKAIKLPVRWMALECLERSIYNTKTDVWSFGIVMWEIITRGMNPYTCVDNWDLASFLQRGRRLSQPDHCPDHVYQIMYSTWSASSVDRPSFMMLHQQLTDLLEEKPESPTSSDGHDDFNDTYINVPAM